MHVIGHLTEWAAKFVNGGKNMQVASNLSQDVVSLLADARSGKGLTLDQLQALQQFQQLKVWKNTERKEFQSPEQLVGGHMKQPTFQLPTIRDNERQNRLEEIQVDTLQIKNEKVFRSDVASVNSEEEVSVEDDSPTPDSTCSEDVLHSNDYAGSSGGVKDQKEVSGRLPLHHEHITTPHEHNVISGQQDGLEYPEGSKHTLSSFGPGNNSTHSSGDVVDSHKEEQQSNLKTSVCPATAENVQNPTREVMFNSEERPIRPGLGAGSGFRTFEDFLDEQLKQHQVRNPTSPVYE